MLTSRDVGPAQVIDRDGIGAPQCIEVDRLDIVDVHDDVADVAGREGASAVGRDVEDFIAALPLNSSVSVPSWPSTTSLPSPGSHWNTSSPAPRKAVSLPCWPSMKSLPSPPRRTSAPLLPRMVSLPAPPSTVTPMRAARLPVALKLSSPPFMLSTSFSVVPMSMLNGAGVEAVEAHPRAIGGRGEDLRAVAAVDLGGIDAVTALGQIGVIARIPDHAVVAGLAEHLVVAVPAGQRVVAVAAEQKIVASLAQEGVVTVLSEELVRAEPPVTTSLPLPPNRSARGSAPLASSSVIVSLPSKPNTCITAGIGDRRRASLDGDGTAVDENVAGCVPAGRDRVVQIVAGRRQHARGRDKDGGNSHCRRPPECSAVRAALAVGVWCAAERIGSAPIERLCPST